MFEGYFVPEKSTDSAIRVAHRQVENEWLEVLQHTRGGADQLAVEVFVEFVILSALMLATRKIDWYQVASRTGQP